MSLSPQERHEAIIQYLNDINKTTKVFEVRWHESQLLTSRVLKSTPISTYIKHKWQQNDIQQLFIRAQCSMGRDFQISMQQSFGSKYKPKLTKKRKSFRGKKISKRKSRNDIKSSKRSLSDLSQISKLYQNGARDSDEENVNISTLYESSPAFNKIEKNPSGKTLLKQSESMSVKQNRNKRHKDKSKYKTKTSNKRHKDESKYQQQGNPYLDASVLAEVDSDTLSPKSQESIPDEGMKMSPLSAQKMLQQMPWKNMEEFGISMEWNVRITRDKDTVKNNLEKENKRLLERIKEIENQLKEQKQNNDINNENESNDNDIKYNFDGFDDNIIILRSECNNKPLIAKTGKLEISNGFIGFEIYSKWKIIKCANGIYKFQEYINDYDSRNNNQNMIRILGNAGAYSEHGEIDVKGNDTSHCQFRAHLVTNKNVIMLESVMFPNKYLAANKNGNVFVYNCDDDMMIMDNKQCMFQVLMIQNNIIIKIQRLDNGKIFPLYVDLNNNISDIKSMIQNQENIAIKKQILYFENNELKDNKSLNTYSICNNNIIDLKIAITKKQIINGNNDAKESEEEDMSSSDDYNDETDEYTSSSSEDEDSDDYNDESYPEDDNINSDDSDEDGKDENEHVPKLNKITSKWRACINDMDVHNGGISCIACSPIDYIVITGGEHDSSLRIWEPKRVQKNDGKLLSEITFVPKRKANVDGTVFSVNMSEDGALIAAGCSWKKTQNGYVVVWNMNKGGNILCDLKSKELDKSTGGPIKRGRHARAMSLTLNTKSLMASAKRVSGSKLFQIKRTDSVSSLRFGIVHCVKLMKFKSKKKKRMNYLLFGGDTTGCVLCWNLSLKNREIPICRINAGNDVIHDLAIIENKYLFSVSHDKTMRYCNIKGLRKKKPIIENENDEKSEKRKFEAIDTFQIYADAEYALHSIALNLNRKNKIQLVFGSRKCTQFEMNQLVVIRHKYGKYLSVKKNNKNKRVLTGASDSNELLHKSTKWNIEYLDHDKIRLRSRKSGKYLRMSRNGTSIDVLGEGLSSEHESIFKWKANEKTLQSQKYPKYFMAIHKENNAIISIKKEEINDNISIEFELFHSNKLNAFKSFFDYIYEPPQDLDKICNLKVRKKLLIVQRKDINHVKVFNLSNDIQEKNILLKRFKIRQCECYKNDIDYERNQLYNMKHKYGRKKSDEDEKHAFRIYDSGISFNQKYLVLCVGTFGKANMRKAIKFSLKGFKIPRSAKKPSSHSFCPQSM